MSPRSTRTSPEASPLLGPSSYGSPTVLRGGNDADEGQTLLEPESATAAEAAGDGGDRHKLGFYLYSVSSEIFVIVSLTLFLPVALETYAREHGRLAPAYTVPCPASTEGRGDDELRCSVRLLGRLIDTASFSLYAYSSSVLTQALVVVSMGSIADSPRFRHRLLCTFAFVGSLFTTAFVFLPSDSSVWWLCAIFSVTATVSYGGSTVCLNAYLPEMGRRTPEVSRLFEELQSARATLKLARSPTADGGGNSRLSASQALMRATDEYNHAKGRAISSISSTGIALGYMAGIGSLLLLLLPIALAGPSLWGVRIAVAGSGLAWGLGTIPAAIFLRPMSSSKLGPTRTSSPPIGRSVADGWRGLATMLREWRRLPSTFTFLTAWFLLSDAFSTLTSTAILFAKTTLQLPTTSLVIVAALTPSAGILGAILFPRLQRSTLAWSNLHMLILLVSCACLVPIWGLLALRHAWQIYILAVVFGALYGSFQAYARTCFSELIPTSQSARWFGLYSITDKSSSFLGPLLVATITNLTGQIRHGFWLILAMLLLALPILTQVDMVRGRDDAERYERELFESRRTDEWEEEPYSE